MAGAVSGKERPSGRAAPAGGFSAQPGKRRTAPAGPARIHAHSRPNPFGQSAATGRLAFAADQCTSPKASLCDDELPLPLALAGGTNFPSNQRTTPKASLCDHELPLPLPFAGETNFPSTQVGPAPG